MTAIATAEATTTTMRTNEGLSSTSASSSNVANIAWYYQHNVLLGVASSYLSSSQATSCFTHDYAKLCNLMHDCKSGRCRRLCRCCRSRQQSPDMWRDHVILEIGSPDNIFGIVPIMVYTPVVKSTSREHIRTRTPSPSRNTIFIILLSAMRTVVNYCKLPMVLCNITHY